RVPEACRARMAALRIRILAGARVARAEGGRGVRAVVVARANGRRERLDCDLLAVSAGWSPSLHLFSQARGQLRFDAQRGCLVPEGFPSGMRVVGAARGEFARTPPAAFDAA